MAPWLDSLLVTLKPYLLTFGAAAGSIGLSLLGGLFSEVFLKRVIILLLARVARRTKTDIDDKLLLAACQAWNVNYEDYK